MQANSGSNISALSIGKVPETVLMDNRASNLCMPPRIHAVADIMQQAGSLKEGTISRRNPHLGVSRAEEFKCQGCYMPGMCLVIPVLCP